MTSYIRAEKTKRSKRKPDNSWLYVLIAYYGFEYVRFQDSILPVLAPLKIPMLLTLALTFYVLKNLRLIPKGKFTYSILIIWFLILAWVPFATNNFHAFQTAKSMSMILFTVFSTIIILNDEEKIKIFITYLIVFFTMITIWVITHGGKGPGGFVADENDVALVTLVAIPFIIFAYRFSKMPKSRLIQVGILLLMFGAIVVSSSRGGFVGLLAVIFTSIWLTKKKLRNFLYLGVFSFFMGGALLAVLPDGYVKDMQTISDTEDSTRNLRFMHWTTAIEIFKSNPVLGVGPSNYPWTSNQYFHLSPYFVEGQRLRSGRVSHSLYFTLIPELGAVGIILFIIILLDFLGKVRHIRRRSVNIHKTNDLKPYFVTANALSASMAGFLSAGAFISVLYYPIFWHLLAITTAIYLVFLKKLDFEN